jgi:HK97 family phage major capsid protein
VDQPAPSRPRHRGPAQEGPVPDGTSSISIPKITGGTSVALQTTQNSTVSATDLTTSYVSTGFTTILGKQVVSQQLLDQSAIPFDEVISADLAAAYNAYFGAQVYAGTGTGANNNSVLNGINNATVLGANQSTFTSASPTAALFYSKANGMLSSFVANRFAPPTHWLMHPRRWYWLMAQVDSQGRPLVVPNDVAFNPIATNAVWRTCRARSAGSSACRSSSTRTSPPTWAPAPTRTPCS